MVLAVILWSSSLCVRFSYVSILRCSFLFILSVTLYRVLSLYLYYTIYYTERNVNNIPLRSKNPENMFWRRYIIYSSSPPLPFLSPPIIFWTSDVKKCRQIVSIRPHVAFRVSQTTEYNNLTRRKNKKITSDLLVLSAKHNIFI